MIPKDRRRVIVVAMTLVAVALVAGSAGAFVYYGYYAGQHGSDTHTTIITDLQSSISSLQSSNLALQAQLSALNTSSSAQQLYSSSSRSVVTVQGDRATTTDTVFGPQTTVAPVLGSGFVIAYQDSMYVVTNYHVIVGDSNLTVTFPNGNAYPAVTVGSDPYADMSVLRAATAPLSEFSPLQVISSYGAVVGQQVYAIGNPYGLSGSMTVGIISQVGRTIQDPVAGNFSIAGVIQFSAPINPGNSGGPLLDSSGSVIGMTTATVTSSQGIGFAIPSSTILRDLPSLVASGTYSQYSYLGIGTVDMNYPLARASGTNVTYGVLIEAIVAGGPADNAGLRAGTKTVTISGSQYLVGGDIIVAINGTKIINQDALSTYLVQNTAAGETINLGVIRSGAMTEILVVLGMRPQA